VGPLVSFVFFGLPAVQNSRKTLCLITRQCKKLSFPFQNKYVLYESITEDEELELNTQTRNTRFPRVHNVFTTCSSRVHHVFTTCSVFLYVLSSVFLHVLPFFLQFFSPVALCCLLKKYSSFLLIFCSRMWAFYLMRRNLSANFFFNHPYSIIIFLFFYSL
jgi:hypothetical protein